MYGNLALLNEMHCSHGKVVFQCVFELGQVSRKFAAAKNGQVSSKFAAAKNGQVISKIAAAKNGQVSSKFAASRKIEKKKSTNSLVLVWLSSL